MKHIIMKNKHPHGSAGHRLVSYLKCRKNKIIQAFQLVFFGPASLVKAQSSLITQIKDPNCS